MTSRKVSGQVFTSSPNWFRLRWVGGARRGDGDLAHKLSGPEMESTEIFCFLTVLSAEKLLRTAWRVPGDEQHEEPDEVAKLPSPIKPGLLSSEGS